MKTPKPAPQRTPKSDKPGRTKPDADTPEARRERLQDRAI